MEISILKIFDYKGSNLIFFLLQNAYFKWNWISYQFFHSEQMNSTNEVYS